MQPELAQATRRLFFEILVTERPFTYCCPMQGAALTVLERYDDAEKAYMEALALGPTDPSLHAALKQARATFGSEPSSAPGPSTAASRPFRRVHPVIAPDLRSADAAVWPYHASVPLNLYWVALHCPPSNICVQTLCLHMRWCTSELTRDGSATGGQSAAMTQIAACA